MALYESGQEIESHRLIEKIGSGGSGEVWKADFLGQVVALKLFSEEECERIKPAIEAQYQLAHLPSSRNRYFIPFEHIQLTGAHRYIRMKWIEGTTLAEFLAVKGRLDIPKALPLIKQILKGLEVIHQEKLIHGDLNPNNIFMPYGGVPLLMDVGLGKPPELQHSLTEEEDKKGRAHYAYAAPERFKEQISPAVDIFSLGKIFYVLLTGSSPDTIKPLSEFPNLSLSQRNEIERFIFRCLEEDPTQRFLHATEALNALDSLQFQVKRNTTAKWEPGLIIPMSLAILVVLFYMFPYSKKDYVQEHMSKFYYEQAQRFILEDQDYEQALGQFKKALEGYKEDYRIYLEIGKCHLELSQLQQAKGFFEKSLELHPQQGEALYHLGLTFIRLGEESRAFDYLERAIQLPIPYTKAAQLLINHGNDLLKKSEIFIQEEALALQKNDPFTAKVAGEHKLSLLQKAERAYQIALNCPETLSLAKIGLGNIAYYLDHYPQALEYYNQITGADLSPQIFVETLFVKALCYHKLKEESKSRALIPRIRQISPQKAVELEALLANIK
jgi:serine/threonine protein kinase